MNDETFSAFLNQMLQNAQAVKITFPVFIYIYYSPLIYYKCTSFFFKFFFVVAIFKEKNPCIPKGNWWFRETYSLGKWSGYDHFPLPFSSFGFFSSYSSYFIISISLFEIIEILWSFTCSYWRRVCSM